MAVHFCSVFAKPFVLQDSLSAFKQLKLELQLPQPGLGPRPLHGHHVPVLLPGIPHAVQPLHDAENEGHPDADGEEDEGGDDLGEADDGGALAGAGRTQVLRGDPLVHGLAHLRGETIGGVGLFSSFLDHSMLNTTY